MILPDSSIWIDHLAKADPFLVELLAGGRVAGHPLVTAEVMLGSLATRARTESQLDSLYQIAPASIAQTRTLVESRRLWSGGIGYVDANLLASALLTSGTKVLTRDKRFQAHAERLGIAYIR